MDVRARHASVPSGLWIPPEKGRSHLLTGVRISPGLPPTDRLVDLFRPVTPRMRNEETQTVKIARERIFVIDRRTRIAIANAQRPITAILCQSVNPVLDIVLCIEAKFPGLRLCDSLV